jgi:hypothetical protein
MAVGMVSCGAALATAAALIAFALPASASTAAARALRPASPSHFNVCDDEQAACFKAKLTFQGDDTFVLSNVRLADTRCNDRSVFAYVEDQDGFLAQFENAMGCHTTATWSSLTISDPHGTRWVQIRLYACDPTSCISIPYSLKHYNHY